MAAAKKKAPAKSKVIEKVIIYDDGEGNWWWSARAGNNLEVSTSGEGYINRMYALKMAKSLHPGLPIEWH